MFVQTLHRSLTVVSDAETRLVTVFTDGSRKHQLELSHVPRTLSYKLWEDSALDTTIVAIRSEGVTIRDTSVPWSSIRQVVVIQPESSASESGEVEIGLRLDPDASLPEELSSLDFDSSPSSEIPSALRTSLEGQPLDRERLIAAVHRFPPESVSIIEILGDTEQELGLKDTVI